MGRNLSHVWSLQQREEREKKKKKIDVVRWRDSSKQKFFKLLEQNKTTSGWSFTNFITQRHFKAQCAGHAGMTLFLLAIWFRMFVYRKLILLVFQQGQNKGSEFFETTGYVPTQLVLNVQPKCYFCCVPLALGKLRRPFKSEFHLRKSEELAWPGVWNLIWLHCLSSNQSEQQFCRMHTHCSVAFAPAMSGIVLSCWHC